MQPVVRRTQGNSLSISAKLIGGNTRQPHLAVQNTTCCPLGIASPSAGIWHLGQNAVHLPPVFGLFKNRMPLRYLSCSCTFCTCGCKSAIVCACLASVSSCSSDAA